MDRHRWRYNQSGQVRVIGQLRHRQWVSAKTLNPGVQLCVIGRSAVYGFAVVERIQSAQPLLNQVLEQEGGPTQMGDQFVLLDARDRQNVAQPPALVRPPLALRQARSGAFHHPAAQLGPGHGGIGGQPLPHRIGAVLRRWMVAAVELIDRAQIGAELIGPGPAHKHAVGQQHAVVVGAPLDIERVQLRRLGRDIPAPRLAVQDRPIRPSEPGPEDPAAVVRILGRHPHAVAAPPVARADPGVALLHHHGEPVEVLERVRRLGIPGTGAAVGVNDQLPVPRRRHGDDIPGAVDVPARQAPHLASDRGGTGDRRRLIRRQGRRRRA